MTVPKTKKTALIYSATPFLADLLSFTEKEWIHPLFHRWELVVYNSLGPITDTVVTDYLDDLGGKEQGTEGDVSWGKFLDNALGNREADPALLDTDSSLIAATLRRYIMLRAKIAIIELDNNPTGAADVILADLMRVPVIGITRRNTLSPLVHSSLQVQIPPHRETMIAVLLSMLEVPYKQ